MKRFLTGVLSALLLLLTVPGCSMDVEPYLLPPSLQSYQKEIRQALEGYLKSSGQSGQLILQTPQSGAYLSSFIVTDLQTKQPQWEEDAEGNYAIAFYRLGAKGNTHIHLLQNTDGEWKSLSDVEGLGSDIERVEFGDLDGDGRLEMMAGWSVYNSRDRQLHVYSFNGDVITPLSTDGIYTKMFIGDVTSSGRDNLLLLRIESGNRVTARLKALRDGVLTEIGSARLDGCIQSFGDTVQTGILADGVTGVYIDAYKDPNTTITELLYWNGSQLYAPFYDPSKNISTATARVSYIPSMDIDADGQIEFPKCSLLPGYYSLTDPKDIESTMWLCDWYAYQYESGKTVREFYAVVNLEDRYYIRIEDDWKDQVTTSYDGETRTLWLHPVLNGEAGEPFLGVRLQGAGTESEPGEDGRDFQLWTEDSYYNMAYTVWYSEQNPYNLDMQKIQYILARFP